MSVAGKIQGSLVGIYGRAMLLVGFILTAATTGVTLWNIQNERQALTGELERRLTALVNHQAAALANPLWDLNRSAALTMLGGLTQDPDFVSARVADGMGKIFAETIAKTVSEDLVIRHSRDIMLTEPGDRRVIGVLTLTMSRERLVEAQRRAVAEGLILGAILLVVMMGAISLVLRMVLKPLSRISNRMLAVAAGDLESPIPYADRDDQIGAVARAVDSFRAVSRERAQTQAALEEAHDEMEKRVVLRTEELRHAEALFHGVIDASPAEISVRDRDGRMLLVNRAWEVAHGIEMSDAVGKTALDLFDEAVARQDIERDKTVMNTGESLDFRAEKPQGKHREFFHTIKFPLLDNDGAITGVGDITSEITELLRAEEQLRQAQKMEAVGQLTGGIAHDFNNLLAIIIGNFELLEDRYGQDDAELIEVFEAARRGADLTQRLLAFSRQQPLRPRPINLSDLTERMADLLKRTLGETIEIETRFEADLWAVSADAGQVENALLNLALNARDAMAGGGKLTVECRNATLDNNYVADNPGALAGEYAVLAVTDTGCGMSDEVQAHVFEPFYTTKEVGEGSGLGLSMIYGFAKQSFGHVSIYSEEGMGTTVKLYLPRIEKTSSFSMKPTKEDMPQGGGETILVVEDDDRVRILAVRMLERLGYKAVDMATAVAAWTYLSDGNPVDLLLSDVVLPGGLSGPELAARVRETHPAIPTIFMSGYPAEAAKRNGFLGSDNVLLSKPFTRGQMARALHEALAAREN